jgi:hypothetical protein
MESFWARLQVELLNTRKWATTLELAAAMADYIDTPRPRSCHRLRAKSHISTSVVLISSQPNSVEQAINSSRRLALAA